MTFEVPAGGISRVTWIDSISGDFLLATPKAGVLRIYNAAMSAAKEVIKVSRHGIFDVRQMTNEMYLIVLKNGQIDQFNIRTKKSMFTTDVAHTH